MPYPYADVTGIIPATAPVASYVVTAVGGIDSAIEDLRTGALQFDKTRFELQPVPVMVSSAGVITINGSYHVVKTEKVCQSIITINGAKQGDVIVLQRASGSGHLRIGEYLLDQAGDQVLLGIKASGFEVLACTKEPFTPAFKAYRATATQSISAGVATIVQWNATSYNQLSFPDAVDDFYPCYDTASYLYLPKKAGLYRHVVAVNWASSLTAGAVVLVLLEKNGSAVAQGTFQGKGVANQTMKVRFQDYATSDSDSYRVRVQQNDAGARSINLGVGLTYWAAKRIGRY